jgi:putative transposase
MKSVKSVIRRQRFPLDSMLVCGRWYIAYASSLRNLEDVMEEHGVFVQGGKVEVAPVSEIA